MITIRPITDKTIWETFLFSKQPNSFFQSWEWGVVQESLGNTIVHLGVYDDKKLVGIGQVLLIKAKRGNFLHLRHGPYFSAWKKDYMSALIDHLKAYGKEKGAIFIRMSPLLLKSDASTSMIKSLGFKDSALHILDAEYDWVLDLDKTEEELLAQMRKTTRYSIRNAEKLGVKIYKGKTKKDFEDFLALYKHTAKRQQFMPHRGIAQEYEEFTKNNIAELLLASYEGQVISAALIVFYGDQAVYHHSGSLSSMNKIPASYLLQWEAIKEAKRKGKKLYNFWGVAPQDKPNHPWKGLTLFKTGFGGRLIEYMHAQDLPLSPKYYLIYLLETAWRIKRGY